MYPEPRVEIHPRLAQRFGIKTDDFVKVTTRRSELTLRAMVVKTIRPDTIFIPYHWANKKSANLLTHLDGATRTEALFERAEALAPVLAAIIPR